MEGLNGLYEYVHQGFLSIEDPIELTSSICWRIDIEPYTRMHDSSVFHEEFGHHKYNRFVTRGDGNEMLDDSLLHESGRLTLAYRDLTRIPPEVSKKFAERTTELDLSYNRLSDLSSLADFTNVHTLILDNNAIKSSIKFPPLPKLRTLWLNKNRIAYLTLFIDNVAKAFPNLKYLSLMNNLAAPSYFNGGTQAEYVEYRQYVISQLLQLTMLDDKVVTKEERADAEMLYMEPSMTVSRRGSATVVSAVVHYNPEGNDNEDTNNELEDSNVHVNLWNKERELHMTPDNRNTKETSTSEKTIEGTDVVDGGSMAASARKMADDVLKPSAAAGTSAEHIELKDLSAEEKFWQAQAAHARDFDAERLYRHKTALAEPVSWRGPDDSSSESEYAVDMLEEPRKRKRHQEVRMVKFGDLTEAQSEEMKCAFKTYQDKYYRDAIPTKHLRKVMRSIGWNLTEKEYAEMQAETDPDATGRIQYKNFEKALRRMLADMDVAYDLVGAFSILDEDQDGAISVSEFRSIMKAAISDLSEEDLEEMIEDMDTDGNGQIEYQEFASLVKVSRNFEPETSKNNAAADGW